MIHLTPAGRTLGALISLALLAVPVSAQRGLHRDLSCTDRGWWDRNNERSCRITEKAIPAGSGALNIDGRTNGGIVVIGTNRRDVLVRAMIQANARTQGRAEEIVDGVTLHLEPGRIYAEGPDSRNREGWSVEYEVEVPAHSDLDLRAHNGGIEVDGVSGTLRMYTLNGGIHLDAVGGDVVAQTTNGGMHVELAGDRWEGKGLDATTTNGGVHVTIPKGYNAHLETGTVNGGVDIDFPVVVQGKIGRRITTDLGRGGATIRVITTNGGVDIRKRE